MQTGNFFGYLILQYANEIIFKSQMTDMNNDDTMKNENHDLSEKND